LHNPFSTRDTLSRYVDIAILQEVKAGRGSSRYGIYLDRTDPRVPPLDVPRNEFWQYRGIDFAKGPVEIGVCHHSSLGGFRIDENAQTSVPRLYAAGETAAGPHGADRMGGHLLLASQVFGARAGRHGASCAKGRNLPDLDVKVRRTAEERVESLRGRKGDRKPGELKRRLQDSAYFDLLVIRTKEGLMKFLADAKQIREECDSRLSVTNTQELVEALELQNLLSLADVEARFCLERTESRGPHYREDFPDQDDRNWLKSIVAKKSGESHRLGTVALDPSWENKGDEKVKMWG